MFDKEFLLKYDIRRIDCNISRGYPSIVTIFYNDRRRKKIRLNIIKNLNLENITYEAILNNDRKNKLNKIIKKHEIRIN